VDNEWLYVLSLLPDDLEESARQTLAMLRHREVKSAECLLRLVLAYGVCDKSLEGVSVWAKRTRICKISDVGVLKRLRYCGDWLKHLINQMLAENGIRADVELNRRVRMVDATFENRPGKSGTDWRIHLGYDLGSGCMDELLLTDPSGGESLTNFEVSEDEIFVGDRGYAHRKGIEHVTSAGGDVIVRINWQNLPLVDESGNEVDILSLVGNLTPGEIGEWQVYTKADPAHGIGSVGGRLISVVASDDARQRELNRIKKQASRKGRLPDERSLIAAGYFFVFTSIPAQELSARDAMELFRFRWQIEIYFRRLKGLLQLDRIRACSDDTCEVYLLSKLLGALLLERLASMAKAFSPWGYRLDTRKRVEVVSRAAGITGGGNTQGGRTGCGIDASGALVSMVPRRA